MNEKNKLIMIIVWNEMAIKSKLNSLKWMMIIKWKFSEGNSFHLTHYLIVSQQSDEERYFLTLLKLDQILIKRINSMILNGYLTKQMMIFLFIQPSYLNSIKIDLGKSNYDYAN